MPQPQPRHDPAGDSIAAIAPRSIWRIRRANGAPLDGMHVWAWCWLMRRTEGRLLPCLIEFKAADLAETFERRSSSSALDWIKSLESAGLVGDVETQRGMFGYTRLRMYDVDEVLGRGELATRAADPQLEIELGEGYGEPSASVVRFATPSAYSEKPRSSESHPEVSHPFVAADRPDDQLALWEALRVRLGENIAEVYLGLARFELSESADTPHRIYMSSKALRDRLRDEYMAEVAVAFADAGLPLGGVALHVDERLAEKPRGSAGHPEVTAQRTKEGLFTSEPLLGSEVNKQTTEIAARERTEKHPLIADAELLFERIANPDLFPWVAIVAMLFLRDGVLTHHELEKLLEVAGDDFAGALKELVGQRRWRDPIPGQSAYAWPRKDPLKNFKSRLRKLGIPWQRKWEVALRDRKSKATSWGDCDRPKPR